MGQELEAAESRLNGVLRSILGKNNRLQGKRLEACFFVISVTIPAKIRCNPILAGMEPERNRMMGLRDCH